MHDDYTPQPRERAAYIPTAWDDNRVSAADRIIGTITLTCLVALVVFGAVLTYAYWLRPVS